jgi:hypothetical protein
MPEAFKPIEKAAWSFGRMHGLSREVRPTDPLCNRRAKLPAKRAKEFGEWNEGVGRKFGRKGLTSSEVGPKRVPGVGIVFSSLRIERTGARRWEAARSEAIR